MATTTTIFINASMLPRFCHQPCTSLLPSPVVGLNVAAELRTHPEPKQPAVLTLHVHTRVVPVYYPQCLHISTRLIP